MDDISLKVLHRTVRASRYFPYVYLQNPKCACTTVKRTLWQAEHEIAGSPPPPAISNAIHRNSHEQWQSAALPRLDDPDQFIFTVVRNPYARVLSAYLEKVAGDERRREYLSRLSGRPFPSDATFEDFLDVVVDFSPEQDDAHWRPQTEVLLYDHIRTDFVGAVETLADDLPLIMERAIGRPFEMKRDDQHRTGAAEKLRTYVTSDRIQEKIVRKYRRDFEAYGYSFELDRQPRETPVRSTEPAHPEAIVALRERQRTGGAAEIEAARPVRLDPEARAERMKKRAERRKKRAERQASASAEG